MTDPLIEAHALTKRFEAFVAVDGIDFADPSGRGVRLPRPERRRQELDDADDRLRVADLGRDAARARPGSRDATAPQIRGRLGVVPQEDNLDTELTVWDNLMIYGRYFDLPRAEIRRRAEELLEFVQLADRRDSRVDPLSGGMKRRLTIARALINQPEAMLLDEPTTGLDPQARHMLWERLYRLKQNGVTLVLTTHYMDEAEQLCDRLVIMDGGRIVAEGSPSATGRRRTRRGKWSSFASRGAAQQDDALARVRKLATRVEAVADRLLVYTDDGDRTAAAVAGDGVGASSVLVRRASLEDVFLILTGRTLEE